MSSSAPTAIRAESLSKCYHLYDRPADRLRQLLWGRSRRYYREFWALRETSFEVARGEALGLVGRNGAGKSTLLQLICGTLTPTGGAIRVDGRVAALLELGAGFNPEFTGRENVFLTASIMGLTTREIEARFDEIVDFSGIRDFIDQPVKTYSSGMYVRLAFSVATSVDPEILVIDEALSVGDGEFARKSFDRIMRLKEAGKTILFCSHSLFQVESLCTRALWLHQGRIQAEGEPSRVVVAYQEFLDKLQRDSAPGTQRPEGIVPVAAAPVGHARLLGAVASIDGRSARVVKVESRASDLVLRIDFSSDPAMPAPTIGVTLQSSDGRIISSCGTWIDGVELARNAQGSGSATLTFARLPLFKGTYTASFYLLCEKGVHVYDEALQVINIEVTQATLELGLFAIPHQWTTRPGAGADPASNTAQRSDAV